MRGCENLFRKFWRLGDSGRILFDDCVREIARLKPRVVGFTTTFHQTCACLAVARGLKQLAEPPVVIFGGANCEGAMGFELIKSFPWIDYVCTGEGDEVAPEFLEELVRRGEARPVAGILKQGDCESLTTPMPVRRMDSLPVPNYSAYFEALSSVGDWCEHSAAAAD